MTINESQKMLVSITTPTFNEQQNIEILFDAIGVIFKNSKYIFEHVVVDNCSTDHTVEIARKYADKNRYPLKIIVNNENFGPDYSPMVAFRHATGDVVIPIVADMQDPPELIPIMLQEYDKNKDLDLICCINTEHSTRRDRLSKLFYIVLDAMKANHIVNFQGYGLYSRNLVNKMSNDPYRYFYFRGVAAKYSKKRGYVNYKKKQRLVGASSYTLLKLLKHLMVSINYLFPNLLFYLCILFSLILMAYELSPALIIIIWISLYINKNIYKV